MIDTEDFRKAPRGKGPYAGAWKHNPGRVVELLCMAVERTQGPELVTQDYRSAPGVMVRKLPSGRAKPHRLVYDLCDEVDRLRAVRPRFFSWKVRWRTCLWAAVLFLVLPFIAAVLPSGGVVEQAWLDQVVVEVERRRDACDDPELRELLDYTARQYNRIGRFNVAIRYCGPLAVGINMPHCPGVTLDPALLMYGPTDWRGRAGP